MHSDYVQESCLTQVFTTVFSHGSVFNDEIVIILTHSIDSENEAQCSSRSPITNQFHIYLYSSIQIFSYKVM